MKATELRIGNLFIEKYSGQIIKVIGLNEKTITFEGKFKNEWQAEPIPLTEEWFYNFGFIIFNSSNEKGLIVVNKLVNPLKYSIFGREIKYVHELQNWYFLLTGEELTL